MMFIIISALRAFRHPHFMRAGFATIFLARNAAVYKYMKITYALYDTVVAHSAYATSVPITMPNTNTHTLGNCGCA